MCDEVRQVVFVERLVVTPLDRPDERELAGDRLAVSADQVNLGVVGSCPVAADDLRMAGELIADPAYGFADDRLDRGAAPRRPGRSDARCHQVSAAALDFRLVRAEEREPEPQVRVSDRVTRFPGRLCRQRDGDLDDALGCQQLQRPVERGLGDAPGGLLDLGVRPLA